MVSVEQRRADRRRRYLIARRFVYWLIERRFWQRRRDRRLTHWNAEVPARRGVPVVETYELGIAGTHDDEDWTRARELAMHNRKPLPVKVDMYWS